MSQAISARGRHCFWRFLHRSCGWRRTSRSSPPPWLVRTARWLGNLTFPIYLFHFPIFVLLGSIGFYDRSSVWQSIALFSAVCAVIALLTPLTDWLKVRLRFGMDRTRVTLKTGLMV